MAREAHIVSFEEARARSRRYSSALTLAGSERSGVGEREVRQARDVRDVRDVRDTRDDFGRGERGAAGRSRRSGDGLERASGTSRIAFPLSFGADRGRSSEGRERREAFESYDAYEEDFADDDMFTSDSRSMRESRSEARRRQRAKARADKMFDRQFARSEASGASAEPEDGAPRAALYEGKMGSSHRKSARMQRSSAAGPVSVKVNPASWLASSPVTARGLKVLTAVLCCVLVGMFLYVPAQQYYQAQREHDRLAAEYDVIEDRNDTLDVQNDILASDAGLEDAVRQKYGYVKAGEQTAVVTGLSDNATDTSRDSDNIEANVLSSSVKTPEEWYTPLLDAFFGVE